MATGLKEILEDNAREYYRNALQAEKRGEYNSAVTLFFKDCPKKARLLQAMQTGSGYWRQATIRFIRL